MQLGIFGGTFDPIHLGHLLLAEYAREHARLDRVVFMPAARSPHKQDRQPADDSQRIELLELAIGGHEAFEVSRLEIDRGGVSYTVDTLTEFQKQHTDASLFFVMGGDSLAEFSTWREPRRILELAIPLVVSRPGSPVADVNVLADLTTAERLKEIAAVQFAMPQIDISSSDIRRRVAAGESIRFQVTRAVEGYIEAQALYGV